MQSAEKIIGRVMSIMNVSTIPDLAKSLGVAQTTVYSWVDRDSINLKTVLAKCGTVDLHWLLTGEVRSSGPRSPQDLEAMEIGREFISLVKRAAAS